MAASGAGSAAAPAIAMGAGSRALMRRPGPTALLACAPTAARRRKVMMLVNCIFFLLLDALRGCFVCRGGFGLKRSVAFV
jgi:hypothetical protein